MTRADDANDEAVQTQLSTISYLRVRCHHVTGHVRREILPQLMPIGASLKVALVRDIAHCTELTFERMGDFPRSDEQNIRAEGSAGMAEGGSHECLVWGWLIVVIPYPCCFEPQVPYPVPEVDFVGRPWGRRAGQGPQIGHRSALFAQGFEQLTEYGEMEDPPSNVVVRHQVVPGERKQVEADGRPKPFCDRSQSRPRTS